MSFQEMTSVKVVCDQCGLESRELFGIDMSEADNQALAFGWESKPTGSPYYHEMRHRCPACVEHNLGTRDPLNMDREVLERLHRRRGSK